MNQCRNGNDADKAFKVLKIIGLVILGIAACFLFGLVIKLLWNWLMPAIFSLKEITYWQGIGLLILSSILFGRLGGRSDDKKKDKGSHPIRDEIKKEIKKEFAKEYAKEQAKNGGANESFEDLYETWWEKQGKDSFEKYAKQETEQPEKE